MATGASVPSDSGGVAAQLVVSCLGFFCSRGSLTPVAAPNASPNAFFGMRIIGFAFADEDVSAPGPSVETGADVPSDSGDFAAWLVVSDAGFFCSGGR